MEARAAAIQRVLNAAGHLEAARAAGNCQSVSLNRMDVTAFRDVYRAKAQLQEILQRYEVATQIRRVLAGLDAVDVPHVVVGIVPGAAASFLVVLTEDPPGVVGVVETTPTTAESVAF